MLDLQDEVFEEGDAILNRPDGIPTLPARRTRPQYSTEPLAADLWVFAHAAAARTISPRDADTNFAARISPRCRRKMPSALFRVGDLSRLAAKSRNDRATDNKEQSRDGRLHQITQHKRIEAGRQQPLAISGEGT